MDYLYDSEDYKHLINAATEEAIDKMESWNLDETGAFDVEDRTYDPENPDHVAEMIEYVSAYPFIGGRVSHFDHMASYENEHDFALTPMTAASIMEADQEWAEDHGKTDQKFQSWMYYLNNDDTGFGDTRSTEEMSRTSSESTPVSQMHAVAKALIASRVRDEVMEHYKEELQKEGVLTEGAFGLTEA